MLVDPALAFSEFGLGGRGIMRDWRVGVILNQVKAQGLGSG